MSDASAPNLPALQALLRTARPDLAEQAIRQQLARFPRHAPLLTLLAMALYRQRRLDAARQAVEEALALAPAYAAGHHVLGLVLLDGGQLPEAERSLNEALRLNPRSAGVLGLRARLRHEQQRYAQGLADTDAALALDPRYVPALRVRAACLRRLQRFAEAEQATRQWLALAPTDADAQLAAGHAALHFHDAARAEEHLAASVQLDPTNALARRQLARAYQNRYPALRLINAYDARYNRLNARVQRGQLWVFPLILLEGLPLALLCLPLLLWLAVDWLRWRLSRPVRQLLHREPAEAAWVRQQRLVAAGLLLGCLGLIGLGAWWCLRLDWSLSWLGPALVAGFSVAAAAWRLEQQQLNP